MPLPGCQDVVTRPRQTVVLGEIVCEARYVLWVEHLQTAHLCCLRREGGCGLRWLAEVKHEASKLTGTAFGLV